MGSGLAISLFLFPLIFLIKMGQYILFYLWLGFPFYEVFL